jgi:hypothetical protein
VNGDNLLLKSTNEMVPKILGHDFELSNTLMVEGPTAVGGSGGDFWRRLPASCSIVPRGTHRIWRTFHPTNGSSAYIDSDHLEINSPEHRSALDHGLWLHAGLRLAQNAMRRASQKLPHGMRLRVAANCSDGREAWGSHLNVCVSTRTFNDMLYRKPHLAGFSPPPCHFDLQARDNGAGMDGPRTYQLSQRADWFGAPAAIQTTYSRL